MATKKKAATAKAPAATETLKMKPIRRGFVRLSLVGISPVITHAWSEKAKKMMRDKMGGKKTKEREPRNPEAEDPWGRPAGLAAGVAPVVPEVAVAPGYVPH